MRGLHHAAFVDKRSEEDYIIFLLIRDAFKEYSITVFDILRKHYMLYICKRTSTCCT